ncbi:MAG: outer membrane protein [Tabrizicola sp.]
MGALVPASPDVGAAWAQEDGHGGGHEGGGGGKGGEGKGGRHGKPVPPVVQPVVAAGDGSDTGAAGAGRSLGRYVRLELGAAFATAGDASWLPPGYPADPQVFFDLDGDTSAVAAIGLGRDYGNGWRGEVSLNLFGKSSFDGPWSYTVPATAGPHADVEGSVRSLAIMANAYRDFDTGGKVTPFVTVGLGLAQNTMGEWTRINPDAGRTRRSFEGNSETGLAWSVGAGLSWDVGTALGSAPAKLDLTVRYFDLGTARGGTTPLPGSGAGGAPVEALNFDVNDTVVALGLRIPM